MTFSQQILLTALDKGALALVGMAVASVFARALERHKARLSLQNSLAPDRIRRIAEVQETVQALRRRLDNEAQSLCQALHDAEQREAAYTKDREAQWARAWSGVIGIHDPALKQIHLDSVALLPVLDANAFWIGESERHRLERSVMHLLLGSMNFVLDRALHQHDRATPFSATGYMERTYPAGYISTRWQRAVARLRVAVRLNPRMPKDIDELVSRLSR